MIWWPEDIPTLKSGAVTLRPVKPGDTEDIYRAAQDPEVARFTSLPANYTLDMAIAFSGDRSQSRLENRTELIFLIEYAEDILQELAISKKSSDNHLSESNFHNIESNPKFAGVISLHTIDIPNHRAEIGYWLAKEARNKGIGTAAAELITEYGLITMGFRRIEALVNDQNEASKRLLLKAGYEFEGVMKQYLTRPDGSQIDMALFSATRN